MERLIKIGSVTEASRARRILLEQGIRTRLTKAETTAEGCGWGLRAEDSVLLQVTRALVRLGIAYEIR